MKKLPIHTRTPAAHSSTHTEQHLNPHTITAGARCVSSRMQHLRQCSAVGMRNVQPRSVVLCNGLPMQRCDRCYHNHTNAVWRQQQLFIPARKQVRPAVKQQHNAHGATQQQSLRLPRAAECSRTKQLRPSLRATQTALHCTAGQ